MYGLNIYLSSFKLNDDIINDKDKLIVSVLSEPEEMKEAITIDADQTKDTHNSFLVNITEKTTKIAMIFWKKSIIQGDTVIGSALLTADQFPKTFNDKKQNVSKTFDIYEPIHYDNSEKREVVGKMNIEFTLTEPYFPPDMQKNRLGHIIQANDMTRVNGVFDDGVYTYN